MDYAIIARKRLDWICCSDLWMREDLWGTDKLRAKEVIVNPGLSELCVRYFGVSKSEWKRKLKEGAIDYGYQGREPVPITEDMILSKEGFHEVYYGKRRKIAFIIPEPWYIGLKLRFAAWWNRIGKFIFIPVQFVCSWKIRVR